MNHKREAVVFFGDKIASEWNNPTFQGLWVSQIRGSLIRVSPMVQEIYSVSGTDKVARYLNFLQFIILAGTLLDLFCNGRREGVTKKLLFEMIFIGVFVFHFFWEAKCQYTFTCFTLLIPCAVCGYSAAADWILTLGGGICQKDKRLVYRYTVPAVVALTALVLISQIPVVKLLCCRDTDTQLYAEYMEGGKREKILPDGVYKISPASDEKYVLGRKDGDSVVALVEEKAEQADNMEWSLVTYDVNVSRMRLPAYDLYLESYIAADSAEPALMVQIGNLDREQEWILKDAGENEIFILSRDGRALTFDLTEKRIFISDLTGAENQKWSVR